MYTHDAVIVGAGLCGLTAAYRLHQAGLSVCVVEGAEQVGGKIQTRTEGGYLLEGGPNTFPSTAQEVVDLCRELNLSQIETAPVAKHRYIYFNGKLQPVPTNPWGFLTTPLLSPGAKLHVLGEPWRRAPKQPRILEETVASFARRRFGREVLDHIIGPFLSGVYAGDPEQLNYQAVFPRLAQMEAEYGSLTKGLWAASRTKKKGPPYRLLSLSQGMAALPEGLSNRLPQGAVKLNTQVTRINRVQSGYSLSLSTGEELSSQVMVLATPAHVSAKLARGLDSNLSQMLFDIPYAPLAVVHFGFRRESISHPLNGFGFLVPRREKVALLGTIWTSSLFPNRAPEGEVLMTNFLGGATHPGIVSWSKAKIQAVALAELGMIFRAPKLKPRLVKVIRYEQAIPQYTLGHRDRCEWIHYALKEQPGLFLTGNYFQGVSLNDCVIHGSQTAQGVIDFLQKKANLGSLPLSVSQIP